MPTENYTLTDTQRKELCAMVGAALVEIRRLGWQEGKAEQAGSLADAFHNVPSEIWLNHFDLFKLRDAYIAPYHEKYPDSSGCDFTEWINEIISMSEPRSV